MKILIVVDMINGFCREGYSLSLSQNTNDIEKYTISRIIENLKDNGKVIFCCDSHTPDAPEFKQYPLHCMKGTIEADVIDSLKPYLKQSIIVEKNTLSIFYQTKLEQILKKIKPTEIEIVGVCTDICDLFAAYELRNRGYKVFMSYKGVLPLDISKQQETLTYLRDKLGVDVEFQ